jgi:hypothetical protein
MRRVSHRHPRFIAVTGVEMDALEFRKLFDAVSNWGRWNDNGQRGALNHLTPARTAAAAEIVCSGVTVTLSQPLRTEATIDVPEPADHHMTMLPDVDIGSGSVRFADLCRMRHKSAYAEHRIMPCLASLPWPAGVTGPVCAA